MLHLQEHMKNEGQRTFDGTFPPFPLLTGTEQKSEFLCEWPKSKLYAS